VAIRDLLTRYRNRLKISAVEVIGWELGGSRAKAPYCDWLRASKKSGEMSLERFEPGGIWPALGHDILIFCRILANMSARISRFKEQKEAVRPLFSVLTTTRQPATRSLHGGHGGVRDIERRSPALGKGLRAWR
jgi:hypothetical protein